MRWHSAVLDGRLEMNGCISPKANDLNLHLHESGRQTTVTGLLNRQISTIRRGFARVVGCAAIIKDRLGRWPTSVKLILSTRCEHAVPPGCLLGLGSASAKANMADGRPPHSYLNRTASSIPMRLGACTNENTNGLVCQYFPKSRRIEIHSTGDQFHHAQAKLQTLEMYGFKTIREGVSVLSRLYCISRFNLILAR